MWAGWGEPGKNENSIKRKEEAKGRRWETGVVC